MCHDWIVQYAQGEKKTKNRTGFHLSTCVFEYMSVVVIVVVENE